MERLDYPSFDPERYQHSDLYLREDFPSVKGRSGKTEGVKS